VLAQECAASAKSARPSAPASQDDGYHSSPSDLYDAGSIGGIGAFTLPLRPSPATDEMERMPKGTSRGRDLPSAERGPRGQAPKAKDTIAGRLMPAALRSEARYLRFASIQSRLLP
jgi:hypothetical protein